jgi:signal transduction histidine kinase
MSFRTRLFGISTLIVSAVLVAVMLLSWSRIMAFEVERLDTRLCIEAKRIAGSKNEGRLSLKLADDLAGKLRVDASTQLLLMLENNDRNFHIQSSSWPQTVVVDALAWSEAKAVPKTYSLKTESQQEPPRNQKVETCQFAMFEQSGRDWRAVLYRQAKVHSFIAVDLAETKSELQAAVQSSLIVIVPFALISCALGAWLIANLTMRPVNRLVNAMQSIHRNDFNHRLSVTGEDHEFQTLISTYNNMLERLEKSFQQASRFSADAAHELKTPLTILRGRLEQAVSQSDPGMLDLNRVLDEVGKLSAITRKLLLLSQADAGTLALHRESLNFSELLTEMASDVEDLELSNEQVLRCHITPELFISGDRILLQQMLNNLLSNAVRYHLPATQIEISAVGNDNQIEMVLSNCSEPVSESSRKRLFDRFFRGDSAHASSSEGSGLGLSLAREIARAHGGDLQLMATTEDVVSLRLTLNIR